MNYTLILSNHAQKQLDKIPDYNAEPIFDAISNLAFDPRPFGCKKLKALKGYRIRVGNYRIIYHVFDQELLIDVIAVGHRKEIY